MKKIINFQVSLELYQLVKEKAKELDISMGALSRIALVEFLKKEN